MLCTLLDIIEGGMNDGVLLGIDYRILDEMLLGVNNGDDNDVELKLGTDVGIIYGWLLCRAICDVMDDGNVVGIAVGIDGGMRSCFENC